MLFYGGITIHLANLYFKPQSLIHLSWRKYFKLIIFVVLVLCRPSSRSNVQVIQLPCVKNAILLFCFFSLQFRRHTINCRLSSTCCNLYWNTYFRLLHHSYHLLSVSFPRRCHSTTLLIFTTHRICKNKNILSFDFEKIVRIFHISNSRNNNNSTFVVACTEVIIRTNIKP
jgi:hypothetical protein